MSWHVRIGLVVAVCIKAICGFAQNDLAVDAGYPATLDALTRKPRPDIDFNLTNWEFYLGDPAEGLHTNEVLPVNAIQVQLPHRLMKPNHPLWYTKYVVFKQPGLLWIEADDGAQVYLGGQKVNSLHGIFFPVKASSKIRVTIRVLNNAMAGGLRSVSFVNDSSFNEYLMDLQDYSLLKGTSSAVTTQDKRESSFTTEHVLKHNPSIVGPYVTYSNGRLCIRAFAKDRSPIALDLGLSDIEMKRTLADNSGSIMYPLDDFYRKKKIYYRVSTENFKTKTFVLNLREEGGPFSFNVWADSQYGWKTFSKLIAKMGDADDAFSVGVGDLVGTGSDTEQWVELMQLISSAAAQTPFYLVPGNHDYDGYYDSLRSKNYEKYVSSKNYFSWTYANSAFLALDPNQFFPVGLPDTSTQFQYMMSVLRSERWKAASWRFIFVHQPLYSQGWAGYQGELSLRQMMKPLIEQYEIDFIISGHTHDYERLSRTYGKQKTTFIVTGGGGGSLEPEESSGSPKMDKVLKVFHYCRFHVDKDNVHIEVIDDMGHLIDDFRISR